MRRFRTAKAKNDCPQQLVDEVLYRGTIILASAGIERGTVKGPGAKLVLYHATPQPQVAIRSTVDEAMYARIA
jgi:hypothetical protein